MTLLVPGAMGHVGFEIIQQGAAAVGNRVSPQNGHAFTSFLSASDQPATVQIGALAHPVPDPGPVAPGGLLLQFFGCTMTPVAPSAAGPHP